MIAHELTYLMKIAIDEDLEMIIGEYGLEKLEGLVYIMLQYCI